MGVDEKRWVRVLDIDDFWEGEVAAVTVDGEELVVIHLPGGHVSAFLNACPHQGTPLSDGYLEEETLVCSAHLWEFDARSGDGVNPATARLVSRPTRVEDDAVWISRVPAREVPGASRSEGSDRR